MKNDSKKLKSIVVLPDIRSAHNVGSIFRTSDAVGVDEIVLCGCTPRPLDKFNRVQGEIAKTALGAEKSIPWSYEENIKKAIIGLKKRGLYIIGVESEDGVQKSGLSGKITVCDYKKIKIATTLKQLNKNGANLNGVAFVFGNEVDGLSKEILKLCDIVADIPMKGGKESLNVAVSTGIVLYRVLGV